MNKNAKIETDESYNVQALIDQMRQQLQSNPLPSLQQSLNKLRLLILNNADIQNRHKTRLLERIEDAQSILDGGLLFSLEEIQRQLHYSQYRDRNRTPGQRISDVLRDFFRAL